MSQPYLVGITGGSASGKTSFIDALRREFSTNELCLISQDNYYKSSEYHVRDDRGHINFDLPQCIHSDDFLQDLHALKSGKAIERREYLFQVEDREPGTIRLEPAPIIVVEGLFIFYYESIFRQLDLKVFIDAADDVKLERRLQRDVNERGISRELVVYQWHNHVLPAYEKYLLPFKNASDLVINNNEHFLNSLEVLKNHFHKILKK